MGRFICADSLVSTGQGVLGNNMFAYCLNNPVTFKDDTGSAAKLCFSDSGRIDDAPWRDHSPGGGGRLRRKYTSGSNNYGEVADKFYTVRLLRTIGKGVEAGATWLWDAYMRGYYIHSNAQIQEAQLILDGSRGTYIFLDDTGLKDAGTVGWQAVQAISEGKQAAYYFALPIPTSIDEAFAIGHALKGLYHFYNYIKGVSE